MRKVREILFGIAGVFAAKILIRPDPVSFGVMALYLAGYFIDRFFSAASVEAKAEARIQSLETELKAVKQLQQQFNLAQGIRSRTVQGG